MARTSFISMRWWCLLCTTGIDQQALLNFYSAISLKQESSGGHLAPTLTHHPDFEPISLCSYSVLYCMRSREAANTNSVVSDLIQHGLESMNQKGTWGGMLTITPTMVFQINLKVYFTWSLNVLAFVEASSSIFLLPSLQLSKHALACVQIWRKYTSFYIELGL